MAMERKSFNEVLKEREAQERSQRTQSDHVELGDATRVKVLSPGRMVFKRFIRNRLAIVGSAILIFMFLFSFAGPLLYPYKQTTRFYKYEYQQGDYAGAQRRTEYTNYPVAELENPDEVSRHVNSAILTLKNNEDEQVAVFHVESGAFAVSRTGNPNVYSVAVCDEEKIGSFYSAKKIGRVDKLAESVSYESGVEALEDGFYAAALEGLSAPDHTFSFGGVSYELRNANKVAGDIYELSDRTFEYTGTAMPTIFESAIYDTYDANRDLVSFRGDYYLITSDEVSATVYRCVPNDTVMVSTAYVFNASEAGKSFSDEFKGNAILSFINGETFTDGDVTYRVETVEGKPTISTEDGVEVAELSNFVVRGVDGKDSFDLGFKEAVENAVVAMEERGDKTAVMTYPLLKRVTEFKQDENGDVIKDENGNPIETVVVECDTDGNPVYEDTEITIKKQVNDYVLSCPILRHLFDINSAPSSEHVFGTDSDGYDVLARMMYGGRISLLVGFIVVIIETVLGTIMGGIAGYFGGWVDNLIMRLVDIFYCIPSMPILIIMGAFMDYLHLEPYVRLAWMMAILGILGWAGIARLVRGQILSLREQEFMVAAEATGVKVGRRIFRHLVPNVMPQLIVSATAGLGGVILTESTLSFLGLGVKHPMATWGTMINSVTQRNEDMIKYTYIWVPVGLLICLTVIAFNFVGDGLRDAFDPKMKK